MSESSRYYGKIGNRISRAAALLILSGMLVNGVIGGTHYSLVMQPFMAIDVPPVILQNGTAGTSLVYTNDTSAKVNVEGFGQMMLYVDTYDGNKTDWTRIGASPHLSAIDYNANFVNVSGNKKLVGDFGFVDSGKYAEIINSVTIQVYAQQSVSQGLEISVWNGSSWTIIGESALDSTWRWENYTATAVLDTWTKIDEAEIFLKSKSSAGTYEVDCARLQVNFTIPSSYDYVLRVNNTVTDSWQVRLKRYTDSNIGRLENCTIYFHNSTDGNSNQIIIDTGTYTKSVGSWYTLPPSTSIYIAISTEATEAGSSDVCINLEILVPSTTVYAQYIITFEIT